MGKVQLSLDVPQSSPTTLHIQDSSFYDFNDFGKGTLQLKPPGFGWVDMHELPFFNIYYTTKHLGLQCGDCDDALLNLPDGVWKINWMLGTELSTAVEYLHLRNAIQVSCYNRVVGNLFKQKCALSRKDFDERALELLRVKQHIDAAKWRVEEAGCSEEGMELYNEAERMLAPYKKECGC